VDGDDGDDEIPELAGLDGMPVPADAAPVERAVVKRPLDGAEVLCPKKKRNAQLCMKVTSRPITLRAMVAMRLFSEPIEFAHHELMAIVKDPEAVEKWAYEMANKKYNKYLYNILQRLWDEDCLTELLFLDTYDYPEEADSSGDMDLAKIFFDLVRSLISIELGVMRYQSCRPPMLFVQTMDKDVSVRNRAVEWCKHAQETVYRVELLAQSDPFFRAFLRDLAWPGNPHVRGIFIGIEEAGHKKLPTDLRPDIDLITQGQNSSLICEETFKHLNACSKASNAGCLSRRSRWHRQLTSSLAVDYGRKMPQITPECEFVRAKKIDDSAFDFTQTDQDKLFSLGHDLLETISSKDFQLVL